jgi:hypothetical protein
MIYLIRWLIGKLRRRTTSPAEPLVAVSGRDEPAVHARGDRFVTLRKVAASDANRGARRCPASCTHTASDVFVILKAGRPTWVARHERALTLVIDPCPGNRPITCARSASHPGYLTSPSG